MSKALYKITLTNWHEHNPGKKKSHKKTMIANNMITDAKVLSLTLSQRWLFINLLLIAGDYANDTVTLTHRQLNEIISTKEGVDNCLDRLQSLQLVTFEKIHPLITEMNNNGRITELKRNNKRINTKTESETPTQAANAVAVVNVEKVKIQISSDKLVEVKKELVSSWSDTYPKDYLDLSLKEMRNWLLSNPHKGPKSNWPKFMNRWFQRGWERYRTTLKSNPVKVSAEELEQFLQEGA